MLDVATKASSLKAIADGYRAELAERAGEFERLRQLPQDLADRMAKDGLYRICTPLDQGGHGLSPRVYAEVVELLARSDASAAWCVFIGITTAFSLASAGTEEFAAILRNPGLLAAGVFAPNGRARPTMRDGVDGYVVNGRWQWGSGTRNAQWIGGGSLVTDEAGAIKLDERGKPEHLTVLFRATEVELIDTWDVMGLHGSGSGDFAVTEVFVPRSRTISRFGKRRGADPVFLFPNFGMLGIGIAAVSLGIARATIEDFLGFANRKVPQGNSRVLAEKPTTQAQLAQAEASLRSGRAFLYEAIDAAWEGALHDDVTIAMRRDLRLATSQAAHCAKRCVDLIFELAGGTAVYRTSPIQRRFRDMHVAAQHMMVGPGTYELIGRLLLDLPTDIELL